MMDHERTEKELQEIFEEIQHSYKTFMDDVLALQGRTFGFARELLENSADPEAEGMWARLEELVDKSKAERERFERLARKSSEAYMKVLRTPSTNITTRSRRPRQILRTQAPLRRVP